VAIVAAGSAARIRVHWLRELAVAFLMAGLLVVERVATPSVTVQVWVLCMIAAVSAGGLLALAGGRFVTRWRRPLVGLGVVLTLWAWALAWPGAALSGSALLAAPLAVAALLAAGSGVAYDRVGPQLLSPGFAAGAWIAFAIDSFGGHPQWITAPVGLAALCSVGLWRRFRGQRGERVTSREIVSLEQVGVVLLVGPSLVQAVTDSPAYVVVALVLGLCVAAWGAVTKVRRRVASGALAVAAAVLIFVAVPLVQLLPSWEGAALWALIAVVGLVAVLVAAFLERGKTAARKGLARFLEVTADWE
jgi:hypothetical protein